LVLFFGAVCFWCCLLRFWPVGCGFFAFLGYVLLMQFGFWAVGVVLFLLSLSLLCLSGVLGALFCFVVGWSFL
jgi:hypothetical protein